jgi:hypothetical protein
MEKFLLPAWGREHAIFQPAVRERKTQKTSRNSGLRAPSLFTVMALQDDPVQYSALSSLDVRVDAAFKF